MRTLTVVVLQLAVMAPSAFATAQYPDKIVYEGKTYDLHTNPMEAYFAAHPDRKPDSEIMSTALWRGYVATFEFKATNLVLKDLEIQVRRETKDGKLATSWKSVRDDIAPKGDDLPIDWFTGILVLPHGKIVNYVHMGYGSTYSKYILLEIENGKLTGKKNFNYRQYEKFKERQFQAYKKTEDYKKQAAELKTKGWTDEDIDSFLRSFIVDFTSKFLD